MANDISYKLLKILEYIFGHTLIQILTNSTLLILVVYGLNKLFKQLLATYQASKPVEDNIGDPSYVLIRPPRSVNKDFDNNKELFKALYSFLASISQRDEQFLSLAVVSSGQRATYYLAAVSSRYVETLKHILTSYLPTLEIEILEQFPTQPYEHADRTFLRQTRHFAFPLNYPDKDAGHFIDYLIGSINRHYTNEAIEFKICLIPYSLVNAHRLINKLRNDKPVYLYEGVFSLIKRYGLYFVVLLLLLQTANLLFSLFLTLAFMIAWIVYRHKKVISESDRYIYKKMIDKLSQPLFKVSLEIIVRASSPNRASMLKDQVKNSLIILEENGLQSLADTPRRHTAILSAGELAAIYYFPRDISSQSESLLRSSSTKLPLPGELKLAARHALTVGRARMGSEPISVGLSKGERKKHMYVLGGTGNGKTTLLKYMIEQDIRSGHGVGILDPHGDLADELLSSIPEDRIKDVIYFNPDDLKFPIGINLLELESYDDEDDLLREKDIITESVVSLFRKVFSENDSGGHRIEYILRNAVQTALTIKNATLFTVYDLLNDQNYRNRVIRSLDNQDLKSFWKNEFGQAGSFQQVKMSAGITSKIGRFLFSASVKKILEQEKSTIDFDDILNGKILICNLSKGLLGEDTSELLGVAILTKLQLSALKRARLKQADRKDFYLYVDEFQNFATTSFVQLLSEARKYKLYLTIAQQSTSQQSDKNITAIILANVGTVVCFRTGSVQDEQLMLPLFRPFLTEGDIPNLPSFNFYIKVSDKKVYEPFTAETILSDTVINPALSDKVVESSRKQFSLAKR